MFIRNTWYVVAEPSELPRGGLLARTVLNERLVLYRTADGLVVAFNDACPHRFAPLSAGRVEGNCIRCPYHGSLYDEKGRCVAVPGQHGKHGMNIGLTPHPVIERHGYIWLWMGDHKRADDGQSIPDWFASADPASDAWQGRADRFLSMPVYYELINDNLHDVSHVEFVHPETLGTTVIPQMYRMSEQEQTPECYVRKDIQPGWMRIDFHAENIQGGPILHQMLAFQRERSEWTDNVDWDLTLRYATPSYFLFNHRTKAVGEADAKAIQIASLHAITPETESSSHYFFHTANNLHAAPERCRAFTELCADSLVFAFNQDKALISEQMKRVPDGGRSAESLAKVSFLGDTTPMVGRRLIRAQIAGEQDREVDRNQAAPTHKVAAV
ncbi:MAG: Rieske 2Fe-2S domain-containing protein [Gammaproteobacteria bacterium]